MEEVKEKLKDLDRQLEALEAKKQLLQQEEQEAVASIHRLTQGNCGCVIFCHAHNLIQHRIGKNQVEAEYI